MLGKNGSAIAYLTALSPTVVSTPGSTNASNFAGYEFGTLIVLSSSAPSALGGVVNMMRSGTSDGTFANFGASIAIGAVVKNGTFVRSWSLDSSAAWYKASYDNTNGASWTPGILIALSNARTAPITQNANTTTFSDVLGG